SQLVRQESQAPPCDRSDASGTRPSRRLCAPREPPHHWRSHERAIVSAAALAKARSPSALLLRAQHGEPLHLDHRVWLEKADHLEERHCRIVVTEVLTEQLAQWLELRYIVVTAGHKDVQLDDIGHLA